MFYISGGIPRREAHFGRGSGRIWLDNLQCNGTESSLEYCVSSQWGENNCGHSEDAGIECRDDNLKNKTTPEGKCSVYVIIRVNMSLVVRKPVFGVSDQVRHKPVCTATEDG